MSHGTGDIREGEGRITGKKEGKRKETEKKQIRHFRV